MVIAAIGCALAGLCYSEFACMLPVAGSAYTYAYATLGEWIAWIIGWDLVIEYAIGAATVSISWSAYVVSLFHSLGIDLPARWIAGPFEAVELPDGMAAPGYANLPAVLIVLLISVLLMIGMQESARVNACIVVIKLRAPSSSRISALTPFPPPPRSAAIPSAICPSACSDRSPSAPYSTSCSRSFSPDWSRTHASESPRPWLSPSTARPTSGSIN